MTTWRDQVEQVCERGNQLLEDGQPDEAVQTYDQAWDLLPTPRFSRPEATWILASIGDVQMQRGDYATAHEALSACMHCPGAIGNPFIHLRLGQAQLELGNTDWAADELMRAYMGGGPEIFAMEDERYLDFLASRAPGIERPEAVELDLP